MQVPFYAVCCQLQAGLVSLRVLPWFRAHRTQVPTVREVLHLFPMSTSTLSMLSLSCRDRMSEVLSYMERNMQELDALAADVAEAAEEAADAQSP